MDEYPKTLTLQPCNCGSCMRVGFKEGIFYLGSGFERPLAEEVKRRYDGFTALLEARRAKNHPLLLGNLYDELCTAIAAAEQEGK